MLNNIPIELVIILTAPLVASSYTAAKNKNPVSPKDKLTSY